MALGERFRSGGAREIARFLSDHQHCSAGFDVHREAGPVTGRLTVTCEGCGEAIAYEAAEPGELAAGPQLSNGGSEAAAGPEDLPAPEPADDAPEGPPAPPPPADRTPERPGGRWLVPVLIGLLIAAGLVMVIVGINRSSGNSGEEQALLPTIEGPPATGTAPAQQGAPPSQVPLDRRVFENRFAIGVPEGWSAGNRDDSISLTAPGDVAEIRIYFAQGARPQGELTEGASAFLADEHPGARIGKPQPQRLGGVRADRVTAVYGGGEEVAVVLTRGGFTYLVLRRVDNGASAGVTAQADASLASFKPKG